MTITILNKEFTNEDISQLGVQDLAFKPDEADKLLEHLKANKVRILGGDILIEEQGKVHFSYDNWYSNSLNYLETYTVAKNYLNDCRERYISKNYLVIVVF